MSCTRSCEKSRAVARKAARQTLHRHLRLHPQIRQSFTRIWRRLSGIMALRIQRRITILPFRHWAVTKKQPQRSPATEVINCHRQTLSVKRIRILTCSCCAGPTWCRALKRFLIRRLRRFTMMISLRLLKWDEDVAATGGPRCALQKPMCNAMPKVMMCTMV